MVVARSWHSGCLVLLAVTASSVTGGPIGKGHCRVPVNGGLPRPQPLLLRLNATPDVFGFLSPASKDSHLTLLPGDAVRVVCVGASNFLKPLGSTLQEVAAVCIAGTSFSVGQRVFTLRELACRTHPSHVARASGRSCNRGQATNIDIGFEVGDDFFKTMDICFDETLRTTLYSQFDLQAGIGGKQSGVPQYNWKVDSFFNGLSIEDLYTRKNQRATIGRLLNSKDLGERYVRLKGDYFLSRGHLTAKADFVLGSQHRATFHYVNVAPQWQTLNGGNWNQLEQSVRQFAADQSLDLKVYTGTHGVMTLPDDNDEPTEIYLYYDENGNVAVPVPKLFWKVVYNPKTEEGVAFVSINNPYIPLEKLGGDDVICSDVCFKVPWLRWKPNDMKNGYSYCCDVNEFREEVESLPPFQVTGLLT